MSQLHKELDFCAAATKGLINRMVCPSCHEHSVMLAYRAEKGNNMPSLMGYYCMCSKAVENNCPDITGVYSNPAELLLDLIKTCPMEEYPGEYAGTLLTKGELEIVQEVNKAMYLRFDGHDEYCRGAMSDIARAAISYIAGFTFGEKTSCERPDSAHIGQVRLPSIWPWDAKYWRPRESFRDNLKVACVLLVQAIDAIDANELE